MTYFTPCFNCALKALRAGDPKDAALLIVGIACLVVAVIGFDVVLS